MPLARSSDQDEELVRLWARHIEFRKLREATLARCDPDFYFRGPVTGILLTEVDRRAWRCVKAQFARQPRLGPHIAEHLSTFLE